MSLKQYLDNGWTTCVEVETKDQQNSVGKWVFLKGKHARSTQTSYLRFCIMSIMLNISCEYFSNQIDLIRYHCLNSEKHLHKVSIQKLVPIKKSKFYCLLKHTK